MSFFMREAIINVINLWGDCIVITKEKDVEETDVSSCKFWVQG